MVLGAKILLEVDIKRVLLILKHKKSAIIAESTFYDYLLRTTKRILQF